MARRVDTHACVTAWLVAWSTIGAAAAYAQAPPIRIERRGTQDAVVEAASGGSVTLVFRVLNAGATAQRLFTTVDLPPGWQVLFLTGQLDLPAQGAAVETVTIAAPRNASAGDYSFRYEARTAPSGAPVTSAVIIRIAERRQLDLSWLAAPSYIPAGMPGTFDLLVRNHGNRKEEVRLELRSGLGAPVRPSWSGGALDAGETRRVQIRREPGQARVDTRETLTATLSVEGIPVTEANLGFELLPEGRAADPPRRQLPATLAIRTGTGRKPGFESFRGAGAVDSRRTTTLSFGFVSRDHSHPLMLQRDRNYLNLTAPGLRITAGDQTWALSPLSESGHYGLGAGGRIDRRHWSAGAFIDTGRHDVHEGSQAGGFAGLRLGPAVTVSAQYLARYADAFRSNRIASIGTVRLLLKPGAGISGDIEAGIGQSSLGTGRAVSALLAFDSRRVSLSARHVRKNDVYPLRDRTGLIDGAGFSFRPFGRLQLEGTLDGTGQIEDPALSIDAPTRQRVTRGRVSWGSLASVTAGRTEWTSPGRDWSSQWRRESLTAELHIPVGGAWLAPGIERGTEATPAYPETRYSLVWLQAGIRAGRNYTADARVEYGRGDAGDEGRTVRRISFGAALQPFSTTRLTVRMSNGGRDAVWLRGTQSISALLDQRLPWRHHVVVNYQRRSGGGAFLRDARAYQVDYVIPIGIPLRTSGDTGKITIRLIDGDTQEPRPRMLVQVTGQSRLTDRDGVVSFTGLKPGDYHVTVSPGSLGPGRTIVPSLPLKISVKGGDRIDVNASVVRTGTVSGVLHIFRSAAASVVPEGIANAILELKINDEHRTAVTDARGRFVFDDVPPGTWRLRVVRADIPPFYLLEQPEMTVDVAAGQSRLLTLRVIPKGQ